MENIAQLSNFAKEAAIPAGAAIMEVYMSEDFEVEAKSDHSPLTFTINFLKI